MSHPAPPRLPRAGVRTLLLAVAALLAAGAAWFLIPALGQSPAATELSVPGEPEGDPERAAQLLRGATQRTRQDAREPDGPNTTATAEGARSAGSRPAGDAAGSADTAFTTGGTVRVHGRVLDPDGMPVPDALVEAAFARLAPLPAEPGPAEPPAGSRPAGSRPAPVAAPRSAGDGSFSLEVALPAQDQGQLHVRSAKACHREGTAVLPWQRGRALPPVQLTLVPICVVTGTVLDDAGQALRDAQVLVVPRQRQRTVAPTPVSTAADGRFAFAVEEPGPCTVQIRAQGFALHIEAGPELQPGRMVDAGTFGLQRGYAIRGTLLGADGAPLPDRQVVAHPAATGSGALPARATSNTEGAFELSGLRRESYALTAPGPASRSFRAGQPKAHVVAAPADGVTLRLDEHLLVVRLADHETGAPIENGEVRVLRRGGQTVESDALGQKESEFLIAIDAGVEYGLVGRASGYQASAELKLALGAQEPRREVPLSLLRERARNELQLVVTADSGEPIEHVRIEVFQVDPRGLTFLQHEDRQSADGVHRLGPMAPGRYQLRIHALRGQAEKLPFFRGVVTVELAADSRERRDVALRRGALFVLHVRDAAGRYLGNVGVQVRGPDGVERPMDFCVLTANTTSCDRNRVPQPGAAVPDDALPPGDYTLEVRSGSLPPRTVPVSLQRGQVTPVELTLQ